MIRNWLKEEHTAFLDQVSSLTGLVGHELRTRTETIAEALRNHIALEENLLYPDLERAAGRNGPLFILRQEHRAIENTLTTICSPVDTEEMAETVRQLRQILPAHFQKEEHLLAWASRKLLSREALTELAARWAVERRAEPMLDPVPQEAIND